MGNPRARYTLEFKLEAVRMVKGGQSLAAVAKILDIRPQTLHNWIKAEQQGRLGGAGSPAVSAEQMEIARLKAELARVEKNRRLWKNCERSLNTSLQFIHLAFLALLLRRS